MLELGDFGFVFFLIVCIIFVKNKWMIISNLLILNYLLKDCGIMFNYNVRCWDFLIIGNRWLLILLIWFVK